MSTIYAYVLNHFTIGCGAHDVKCGAHLELSFFSCLDVRGLRNKAGAFGDRAERGPSIRRNKLMDVISLTFMISFKN